MMKKEIKNESFTSHIKILYKLITPINRAAITIEDNKN